MIFITSCYKEEIEPIPKPVEDIFVATDVDVFNGQDVSFLLENGGIYILKLVDVESNQVLSKEKINLLSGKNNIKIYTKSIPNKYLYLVLEDLEKKEIKRTRIKIN